MCKNKHLAVALLLAFIAVILISVPMLAQAKLRIARPLDGATVRGVVSILVPAASVPVGGFVSYDVDGRFSGASYARSDDQKYYVYRWDSKAQHPDASLPDSVREPRDGKHTISVQVYDANNKAVPGRSSITVYVRNTATAIMPRGGILLRYKYQVGIGNTYRSRYIVKVARIEGARNMLADAQEAAEGGQVVLKRSTEDRISPDVFLIRQKVEPGSVLTAQAGKLSASDGFVPRTVYRHEDSYGHVTDVIPAKGEGTVVAIDMPYVPTRRLHIGDSWTHTQKVFQNPMTGASTSLQVRSTLEGLEWDYGYPCAKIKSRFKGIGLIPFSTAIDEPAMITGETTTLFAYTVGKIMQTRTVATVNTLVQRRVLDGLIGAAAPATTQGPTTTTTGGEEEEEGLGMARALAGLFGVTGGGSPTAAGVPRQIGPAGVSPQSPVSVEFEVEQSLGLVR